MVSFDTVEDNPALCEVEETKEAYYEEEDLEEEKTRDDDTRKTPAILGICDKVNRELDQQEDEGRTGFRNGKYHYSYDRFKQGLRSVADMLLMLDKQDESSNEEIPVQKLFFQNRQRQFAVNGAAACIKIGHYTQGLECSQLVLTQGPTDLLQLQKATFRAGVCARHLGDLAQAKSYLHVLLKMDGVDDKVKRDVRKELQGIKEEEVREKEFAQNMVKGTQTARDLPTTQSPPSPEELKRLAEVEEKRQNYIERKEELKQRQEQDPVPVRVPEPEVALTEDDCLALLDKLAQRYAQKDVQDAIKEATMDHDYEVSAGFIKRSFRILAPLQKDLFREYGFGTGTDYDVGGTTDFEKEYKAHQKVNLKFQQTVRYLSQSNESIKEKADLLNKLAFGGDGGLLDAN